MSDLNEKEVNELVKRVFDTDDGKRLLGMLKSQHVDVMSLRSTPEQTMYHLGQKDLVQALLLQVRDPETIDAIIVKEYES